MADTQSKSLIKILEQIPYDSWLKILRNDPVWIYLEKFHANYKNGKFSVLLIMLALNAYQLKGKAESKYWYLLQKHLAKYETPIHLQDLEAILIDFYRKERLPKGKIKRVSKFLTSKLAQRVWVSDLHSIAEDFQKIWYELASTMNQKYTAKTIVFSMKCLGISLSIHSIEAFNYNSIPIPVDSRIQRFTKRVLNKTSLSPCEIQSYWNGILARIRAKEPKISMIHLDSLIWQIEPLKNEVLITYLYSVKKNAFECTFFSHKTKN